MLRHLVRSTRATSVVTKSPIFRAHVTPVSIISARYLFNKLKKPLLAPPAPPAPSNTPPSPITATTTQATTTNPNNSTSTNNNTKTTDISDIDAAKLQSHPILKRVPKFLQKYCIRFIDAPFSHVTAFLILHELTAIVPLVGIWWVLHKYNFSIPLDLPLWAIDKGTKIIDKLLESVDFSKFSLNDKWRIISEGAYAYVIVKFLLPVRVFVSLALMPWFARTFVVPFTSLFSKKKKPQTKLVTTPPAEVKVKPVTKPRL